MACVHSLPLSLAAGWIFQIQREINDSHLNVRREAVHSELYLTCRPVNLTWAHLGIKIFSLNTQVSIDHIKAHQQAPHHDSLLFHHQCARLIKFTERQAEIITCLVVMQNIVYDNHHHSPQEIFAVQQSFHIICYFLLHEC